MEKTRAEPTDWDNAYVTFGKLIAIDRKQGTISVESKLEELWTRDTYKIDSDLMPPLKCLGEDHEVKVLSKDLTPGSPIAGKVFSIEHSHQ